MGAGGARRAALPDRGRVAGVALFDPVNVYALSYRATEYGFLFVLFTFAALALGEVLAGVRLHPMQYLLVGSALAVFFLLLMALSEHVAFGRAYAARRWRAWRCSPSTCGIRSARAAGGAFFALFAPCTARSTCCCKSEDHAMLMGSLLVFALLAWRWWRRAGSTGRRVARDLVDSTDSR